MIKESLAQLYEANEMYHGMKIAVIKGRSSPV